MVTLPPAVIVGADLNGLGLARSLRRGGMPVFVLDTDRWLPAMWARGCQPVLIQTQDRTLIDELLQLRDRFDEDPLLFLASELAVFAVSEARDRLAGYRFRLSPDRTVLRLSDKIELQRLAEGGDFPLPRTVCLETMADLAQLHLLAFPAIVKPADKRLVHAGQTARIHQVGGLAQAQTLCANLLASAVRLVAQEWIPGDDSQIYFCLFYCGRQGVPVSMFTGRKIVGHPPGIGSTGICVASPEAKVRLEPLTRRFIEHTGFEGMGSMEFKWHTARREFLIIEPTVGRTDWQEEVATLCGENIPLAAYRHELCLPQAAAGSRSVIWRATFRQQWPTGMPRPGAPTYDGYWRITDPGPAIVRYLDTLLRHTSQLVSAESTLTPKQTAKS
jgi:D-aspartate ligase